MLAERYTKTILRGKAVDRYQSSTMQARRGHGLGSIIGALFRRAMPFLSSGTQILGQQAVNVASDMIDGISFQDSVNSRL